MLPFIIYFLACIGALILGVIIGLVGYNVFDFIRKTKYKKEVKTNSPQMREALSLDGGNIKIDKKEVEKDEQEKYEKYRQFERLRREVFEGGDTSHSIGINIPQKSRKSLGQQDFPPSPTRRVKLD